MARSRSTALVIGAGIGGIAAAARLAQQGYDVTVLEKNVTPGGRCSRIEHDGHRFDVGATLFLMPEVFAETFAALGERMEDHLDLRRIDPTYRIHFHDDTTLALTADLPSMQAQVEALEPGSFGGLLRYLAEGERHYRLALEKFVGRNFVHAVQYFNPANLKLIWQMKPLAKHYNHIGSFFKHPYLKAAFTFQNMYLGLSPFDAPATYSLLQYTELGNGVWFPIGGMYRVIERLESIARSKGVRFVYNAPVTRIETDGSRATGITLADGSRLEADVIVANADLPTVYRHLLPDARAAQKLDRKQYTCSSIMFYWGVDKRYDQLGLHNIYLAEDYRGSFDQIFKQRGLPDEPSFYIHAPAHVDPDAAPDGQDTLFGLVPVGHLDAAHPLDWDALRDRAREAIFARLAQAGITDLAQHIKFELTCSPVEWEQNYGLAKGATFGLSHTLFQVGYLRPHNRHARYRNLYFCGSSTHPGAGVPMALLSARLVSERIAQEVHAPHAIRRTATVPAVSG